MTEKADAFIAVLDYLLHQWVHCQHFAFLFCIKGDALKTVMQQDVMNAINHGHISLKGLKSER